jgi:DNA (cytosine-5)-methyltransferase 1
MGLVGLALENAGCEIVYANDIDPMKAAIYAANFDERVFDLLDVREVVGATIPDLDLATASFPCTDLSLAGGRKGLAGQQSGMFWEFARILDEMGARRPRTVLLENVPGFASSHGGEDLRAALARLNDLGYYCDILLINARVFVPQSRPRLFIVASQQQLPSTGDWEVSALRPQALHKFVGAHPQLQLQTHPLQLPTPTTATLADIVERLPRTHPRWWKQERVDKFLTQLSPLQAERLARLRAHPRSHWATAYRRTRAGVCAWEIRADAISGCLRATRGGSSKQALVEAGRGRVRVRWMTPLEYGRLQGVGDTFDVTTVSENQALFAFGDAVCLPVVEWLLRSYVLPLTAGELEGGAALP